ncbi:replication initiation factor domain-containing protein [Pseudolactococcus yaeyamensis]
MNLKEYRLDRNLTQLDIAKAIGKTKSFVSQVELGKKKLTDEYKEKIKIFYEGISQAEIVSSIDWLRLRFKTLRYDSVIEQVLKIDLNKFHEEEKGGYNYPLRQQYGHMKIFHHIDDIDMGTMFEISGQGCREFEFVLLKQGRTWEDFFMDAILFSKKQTNGIDPFENFLKVTRFDIALDELYSEDYNYDLHTLRDKFEKGLIKSDSRKFEIHEDFIRLRGIPTSKGLTIYIASRTSPCYLCCYEKDKEQSTKTGLDLVQIHNENRYKNRYEIRLSDDKANQFMLAFIERDSDITRMAKDVIYSLVMVLDEDGGYDLEWIRLWGSCRKYKFLTKPRNVTEESTKNWIKKQLVRRLRIQLETDNIKGDKWLENTIKEYELTDEDWEEIKLNVGIHQEQEFISEAIQSKDGRQLLNALGYNATHSYVKNTKNSSWAEWQANHSG